MKLKRVEFQNFRLLRDLVINFATDSEKKLTVIRAENDSGKTTIMIGIQWAFYGDSALPHSKKDDYRLYPIDWDITVDSNRVPVSVTIEFETTVQHGRRGKDSIQEKRIYRLVRSTYVTLNGESWKTSPLTLKLFLLTNKGSEPIQQPEVHVSELLPPELREVFFTDGDRALNFIEASLATSAKRDRVGKAIRSLLGLGVIEDTLNHIKKAGANINKSAKANNPDEKLTGVLTSLVEISKNIEDCEEKINDSKIQFSSFDLKVDEIQKQIENALVRGNREDLKREIERIEMRRGRVSEQLTSERKKHAELFKNLLLSRDLLYSNLTRSTGLLNDLHDRGKIPNATIPVLEERLKGKTCICGESLEANYSGGQLRRQHIEHLIEESRKADELQNIVTDLYYESAPLFPDSIANDEHWATEYTKVFQSRDELELQFQELGKELRSCETKLADIPDIDIQGLRTTRQWYIEQRDKFNRLLSQQETRLEGLKTEKRELESLRDNLLRQKEKGDRILSELEVVRDIEQVLNNSYKKIQHDEISKVSERMNSVFLEMIGVDVEQEAIIQNAKISNDFDILVYGPENRSLNPDIDLNGASRRALTLSFILALAKVSEVEAPNVIDTPLGMMSGYVKKSVLRSAIRESTQLILFLTRSEIADCEEILEDSAGCIITLTNSAHYPLMLVNKSLNGYKYSALRCNCGIHQECDLCQRHLDLATETHQIHLDVIDGA